MLFGLFFGAGNLIFPIYMGSLAGGKTLVALIGFLITGVSLPLLGVTSIGVSKSEGLIGFSSKVGKLGYTNIVEFGGIPDWKGETVSGE